MTKRIYAALVSLLAVLSVGAADASAGHDAPHHHAAKRTHKRTRSARQRTRAQRRTNRRAVAYVCPMHPDIRERARGTCPKCMMDLVAEPRGAKTGGAKSGGGAATGGM